MTISNPYRAPEAEITLKPPVDGMIHQNNGLLLIPIGSKLPDICLFTGRSGTGRHVEKKLVWMSPWLYLLLLVNWLILLIVYVIVKKEGRLTYYVDHAVLQKGKRVALVSWLVGLVFLALMFVGLINEVPLLIGPSILIMLVTAVAGLVMYPKLKISLIDKQYIHLKGVPQQAIDDIIARATPQP